MQDSFYNTQEGENRGISGIRNDDGICLLAFTLWQEEVITAAAATMAVIIVHRTAVTIAAVPITGLPAAARTEEADTILMEAGQVGEVIKVPRISTVKVRSECLRPEWRVTMEPGCLEKITSLIRRMNITKIILRKIRSRGRYGAIRAI